MKRENPRSPREVEPRARRTRAAQLEDPDRSAGPLDFELAEVGEVQITVREALGGFGHVGAARFGQRLHSLREPDSVTDRRVLAAALGADISGNDLARVDADPGRETEAERSPQLGGVITCQLAHPKGRVAGPLGVVFLRYRSSEQGHDSVARELVDRAAELLHALAEQIEEALHDRAPFLWVDLFRQIHRSLDVGEHNRHLFALAAQSRDIGRLAAQHARAAISRRSRGGARGVGVRGRELASALVAKPLRGRVLAPAGRARDHGGQCGPAATAKARVRRVGSSAARATDVCLFAWAGSAHHLRD